MMRRMFCVVAACSLACCAWAQGFAQEAGAEPETIVVDAKATGTPFPHFWAEGDGLPVRAVPRDS